MAPEGLLSVIIRPSTRVLSRCLKDVLSRKNKKLKFQFIAKKNNVSFIVNKIKRSRTVVSNFIKNPEMYGETKCPGRPPKLTATARRRLLREASKGKSRSKELQQKLQLRPVHTISFCVRKQWHSTRKTLFSYLLHQSRQWQSGNGYVEQGPSQAV